MKVRTVEQLYDRLTKDLAWRRKEIAVFQSHVERARDHARPALLRGAIALLYAHWEGFVKDAYQAYMAYLGSKGLEYRQVRPELAALCLRRFLHDFEVSGRAHIHTALVSQIRDTSDTQMRMPSGASALIGGNLNFERLEDVLSSIGCDCGRYARFEDLIDVQLLSHRNRVAHGEYDFIGLSEWLDLRSHVEFLMEDRKSVV